MTTFDGLIITFADGREIIISPEATAWAAVAIAASLAAVVVFFLVRWINRRDDPTSHTPVGNLHPIERNSPASLRGSVQYRQDIVGPMGEEWNADL